MNPNEFPGHAAAWACKASEGQGFILEEYCDARPE
jgi:hypothetical protein